MDSSANTFDSQRTAQREVPPDGVLGEGAEVGAYVVRRRLGAGAMGAVYAAWDPRLEREVALKVLHLDGDLLAEARLLAKLNHPHVVAVHEVFTWHGRAVLVMELVHGQTLHEWLKTHSIRERLAVLQQCAEGLEAAHAVGIVHRDFKPMNVLVDERGRARLVDFGLALHGREGGALAGSPAYMPLQQLEGASATANSDQFAWWVTVHEALTRRVPHDGPTLEALTQARREGRLDLKEVPRWLRASLTRGLSNDPRQRFPTMREASRALVPPRRVGVVVAIVVAMVAIGAFAWPSHSACDDLIDPRTLVTDVPALAIAVNDYAAAQAACRALPTREQPERALCLDTVGRELDVALAASEDFSPELAARVLKRVRPSARCEKSPLPPPSPIEGDRAAIIESLKVQLRFDALREKGDLQGAAALASEHAKTVASAPSPTVRAWAGYNEASGWAVTWRSSDTLQRLRELEGIGDLGPREQAWISLGRWMFECHASSRQHCEVAERQARSAVSVLDEPWADAFVLEVQSSTSTHHVPVREIIDVYRRIPGARFELERAVSNELAGALMTDERLRRIEALKVANEIELASTRAQQARLSLEVAVAVSEGDLMRAARARSKLDALPGGGPDLERARFDANLQTLLGRGESQAALALLETATNDPRLRYRRLIVAFQLLSSQRSPRAKEVMKQLQLVEDELQDIDFEFYETTLALHAMMTGDVDLLRNTSVLAGWEVFRAWQVAVLSGDDAAEQKLYADAKDDEEFGAWLSLEEALQQSKFEDVVKLAPEKRAACASNIIEQQMRLAEATARWKLGERDVPCRLVTHELALTAPTPRQRQRFETLRNGCTFLGLTPWPK